MLGQTISEASMGRVQDLYTYLDILSTDSPSIRLLDIDGPGSGPYSPLRGHLRVAKLKDFPSFTALSYVWGQDATDGHSITFCPCHNRSCDSEFCNTGGSCSLKLTPNCYAALQRLRQLSGPLTIWVDSICINQESERDKNNQIPLMGEIYMKAKTVYIWLGEGNVQTDRAMRNLRMRGSTMSHLPLGLLAAGDQRNRELVRSRRWHHALSDPSRRLMYMATQLRGRSSVQDIQRLLESEWTTRVWTFQEVILATNPLLVCGSEVLKWHSFTNAIFCDEKDLVDHVFGIAKLRWTPRYSNPTLEESMTRWKSIIMLWLQFPRPIISDAFDDTDGIIDSVLERIKYLYENSKFEAGLPVLSIAIRMLFIFSCIAAALYLWFTKFPITLTWIVLPVAMVDRLPIPSACRIILAGLVMFILAQATFLLWVCGTFVCSRVLGSFYKFCGFFLRGLDLLGLIGQNTKLDLSTGEMRALEGIQVALRERSCSRPEDRVFAFHGVLSTLGVSTSATSLGITRPETTPVPKVDGNRLVLRAQYLGTVYSLADPAERTVTNAGMTTDYQDPADLFISWFHFIRCYIRETDPYDRVESYLYAMLKGLTPNKQPIQYHYTDSGLNGRRQGKIKKLPLWKWPYDFSSNRGEFKEFCQFLDQAEQIRESTESMRKLLVTS